MPASGNRDSMSQDELQQRQEANRRHGVYAVQSRGESALRPKQAGRRGELQEILRDKEGIRDVMRERAASAVLIVEIAEGYVAKEAQSGKALDQIPLMKQLAAFQNSAQRALSALYAALPDEERVLDLDALRQEYREEA